MENGVVVVGGGIGGLAAAVGLQRVGIPVTVLERAPHLREAGACIMMQSNAWRALTALGVADELRAKHTMQVERMEAYNKRGKQLNGLNIADCAGGPHELRGLVRNELQSTLAAQLADGVVRTSTGVKGVSHFDEGPVVELEDGSSIRAKVVVGADGVMSKVGASLGLPKPQYAGWSCFRGMADFEQGLPDPRPAFRVVMGGPEGLMSFVHKHKDKGAMRVELERWVVGLPLHIQDYVTNTPDEHLYLSIVGDRKLTPGEAFGRGCVTALGDAAHPTTPAVGQGGAMALEDAVDMAATLRDACCAAGSAPADAAAAFAAADPAAIADALRAMERRRTARCAPLVDLAHNNAERAVMPQPLPMIWLRDFLISTLYFNPKKQLEYTLGWQASTL